MEYPSVLQRMARRRRKVPQWRSTVQLHLRHPWLLWLRYHPLLKMPLTVLLFLYYSVCVFIKFVEDAQHCIVRTDVPTSTTATKAAHQPAYLRSFKLPTPKAAIAPKVTLALSELGISHSRLVMPTRENVVQFESLLDTATALIEIKRLVDKADYDIKVSRNRLGLREKSQSVGDREPKVENDDAMDIDYTQRDDIEEGDGRGESVVSGRSRKHVSGSAIRIVRSLNLTQSRRSLSVSSGDTAVTVSTRAGTKRQKRS